MRSERTRRTPSSPIKQGMTVMSNIRKQVVDFSNKIANLSLEARVQAKNSEIPQMHRARWQLVSDQLETLLHGKVIKNLYEDKTQTAGEY